MDIKLIVHGDYTKSACKSALSVTGGNSAPDDGRDNDAFLSPVCVLAELSQLLRPELAWLSKEWRWPPPKTRHFMVATAPVSFRIRESEDAKRCLPVECGGDMAGSSSS